jgi:hypothetical protein
MALTEFRVALIEESSSPCSSAEYPREPATDSTRLPCIKIKQEVCLYGRFRTQTVSALYNVRDMAGISNHLFVA